jgi:hypothetical protein
MTSHTNKSLYLKWGELILIQSKDWINILIQYCIVGLDQYTSPGIQYCNVNKIKQYGWLIYSWWMTDRFFISSLFSETFWMKLLHTFSKLCDQPKRQKYNSSLTWRFYYDVVAKLNVFSCNAVRSCTVHLCRKFSRVRPLNNERESGENLKAWFPYGHNGRKNRVTIFLNGQFIIVYTCKSCTYKS